MNGTDTIEVDFTAARALTPAGAAEYSAAGVACQIAALLRTLRDDQQAAAAVAHLEHAAAAFDELGDDLFDVLADGPEIAPGLQLAAAVDQAFRLIKAGQSPEVAHTILQRALASYRTWLHALSTSSEEIAAFDVASAAVISSLLATAATAPTAVPRATDDNSSQHRVCTLIAAPGAPPAASTTHNTHRCARGGPMVLMS
jgi:hypothetical protein